MQLVSFDYDGVLVDSLSRILRLITRAQADLGIGRPPSIEDLQNVANLHLKDIALSLGIPPEKIPELVTKISEIQREDGSRPSMFSGIPEVVRQIARSSIIVVITFNLREEVMEVLSAYGLEGCVSLVLDGADPRPKRERIRWALEHFDVNRRNAYMVGDARSDIREGRAAGVQTVAVAWGYQPREVLLAEDPDFVAERPEELVAILNRQRRNDQEVNCR
jgi:phosphoglycolate phosphatase-like HAD superfamily hydrolase